MMDARSQVTHVAALVVRIATWLRDKAPSLPYRIIFGHNYSMAQLHGLGGQYRASLIHKRQGLYTYVRTARFVRVSALMPLLGPENPDCPEFISLKSPQYIF